MHKVTSNVNNRSSNPPPSPVIPPAPTPTAVSTSQLNSANRVSSNTMIQQQQQQKLFQSQQHHQQKSVGALSNTGRRMEGDEQATPRIHSFLNDAHKKSGQQSISMGAVRSPSDLLIRQSASKQNVVPTPVSPAQPHHHPSTTENPHGKSSNPQIKDSSIGHQQIHHQSASSHSSSQQVRKSIAVNNNNKAPVGYTYSMGPGFRARRPRVGKMLRIPDIIYVEKSTVSC
jgi:hypothetical protein